MAENENSSKKIDAKEAVKIAVKYYKDVAEKITVSKLRLEEIELVNNDNDYRVTLSYPQENSDLIFGYSDKRDYKEFIVDSNTSQVKAMKIRQL